MLPGRSCLLLQCTITDNVHLHSDLLPASFVAEVHARYPRDGWGGCFKGAMQAEVDAKPWAHASELHETGAKAWDLILTNTLERDYK